VQYSEGNLGRVFVLRMDHGEDLIASLQKFVQEKEIASCFALFIGALRDGRAVTGPEEPVVPPVPHFESFESAWEVFGMATTYPSSDGPKLHIHSAIGRGREALAGCVRERAAVYLVVEAVLFEFSGLSASRELDERMGLYLLSLEKSL
jgi:predicted DNA-binding protein with PD1-like motif